MNWDPIAPLQKPVFESGSGPGSGPENGHEDDPGPESGFELHWGQALIHNGLAGLVPLERRGRFVLWLGLVFSVLGMAVWLGLPFYGAVLGLVLAFVIETLDYRRRQRGTLHEALLRPTLLERIRSPFYWTLAASTMLTALLHSEASLLGGLSRGVFQWLCFRALEDLTTHPERYGSLAQFFNWLRRLWRQAARATRAWIKFAAIGTLVSIVVNLGVSEIWQSVGHAAWNRLLIFGLALYIVAVVTFVMLSRSMVRTSVSEATEQWTSLQDLDLEEELYHIWPDAGMPLLREDSIGHIGAKLQWKNEGNLLSRVGRYLEASLERRTCWATLFASVSVLVCAVLVISMSAFLLIPRDVMTRWASTGQAGEKELVLAVDDLAEVFTPDYWRRIADSDWRDLAQEPLPKLAFLEAVILVSLFMFETGSGQLATELEPAELRRWLALGIAYLTQLESEFQYLYSGFITRKLTGRRTFRAISMKNEVLLVPFAGRRAGVYRSVCDFLQVYEAPGWSAPPFVITVFGDYDLARKWALRFLRFSSLVSGRPRDLDRPAPARPEPARRSLPERCWIWSGNRLVALSSFEEARRYARFVALYTHSNGRDGRGRN
jgi:hypothetical protein